MLELDPISRTDGGEDGPIWFVQVFGMRGVLCQCSRSKSQVGRWAAAAMHRERPTRQVEELGCRQSQWEELRSGEKPVVKRTREAAGVQQ